MGQIFEPLLTIRQFEFRNRKWDSRAAILLLDSQARASFSRLVERELRHRGITAQEVELFSPLAQASMAESLARKYTPAQAIECLINDRSRNFSDFTTLLSPDVIQARIWYEEAHAGLFAREVVGCSEEQLEMLSMVRLPSLELARRLLIMESPTSTIELEQTETGMQAVYDGIPARYATWVLPRAQVVARATAIAKDLSEIDDPVLRRVGMPIDARNEMLVGEAIVRGYNAAQTTEFILREHQDAKTRGVRDSIDPHDMNSVAALTWLRLLGERSRDQSVRFLITQEQLTVGSGLAQELYSNGTPLNEAVDSIRALARGRISESYTHAVEELLHERSIDAENYREDIALAFASGLTPEGAADSIYYVEPSARTDRLPQIEIARDGRGLTGSR